MAKLESTLETISKGCKQGSNKYKIHSIALQTPNGASSTLSAHMQTMSLLHDHQDTCFDPTIACDVIEPALEVERVDKEQMRMKRIQSNGNGNNDSNGAINSSNASNSIKPKPKVTKKSTVTAKKSTSAAAFFKTEDGPQKKTKASKPTTEEKKKPSTAKKSSAARVQEKDSEPPQKKGNADDFVGDVDEDDDFLKEDEERKTRNSKKEKKASTERKVKENSRQKQQEMRKPPTRAEGDEDVDMDPVEDEQEVVQGAMDEFASKKPVKRDSAEADQKGRKRRKQVLEEKTFVDENGFFRTETVSVWKDIEDDEVEKSSAKLSTSSAAKVKPKATKNMKQQGLMGFFAKK